jgi:hypothetical protein
VPSLVQAQGLVQERAPGLEQCTPNAPTQCPNGHYLHYPLILVRQHIGCRPKNYHHKDLQKCQYSLPIDFCLHAHDHTKPNHYAQLLTARTYQMGRCPTPQMLLHIWLVMQQSIQTQPRHGYLRLQQDRMYVYQ